MFLLSSSLKAACASSHQPVTAAISLSREEKTDSTFLELLVDVAYGVRPIQATHEAGNPWPPKLMKQEIYQLLILPNHSCPWSGKRFPSSALLGEQL